ncbi:MAG: PAS domain S-box protein [Magnetococcales bacterium]|nr:PAS domain S-box protein [Magnetococcales bacterium]
MEMIDLFLKKNGYQVILARNGREAVAAFRDHGADLILMDAFMPETNGFEACIQIKQLQIGCKVPIIMITGLNDNESVHRAFGAGAEEFITKPINWAVLQHRMELLLDQKQMEAVIHESEERFRAMAESAKDAIISITEKGKIIYWNHGAETMFGYSREEILGTPLEQIIPTSYLDKHRHGFHRAVQTGHMHLGGESVELQGICKNGRILPVEISLSSWKAQKKSFFSAIVRDITERTIIRRRQDETLQSQLAITALLETSLEPLTFKRQLEVALEIITTVPWIQVDSKSAIFLCDSAHGRFELAAQLDLPEELANTCGQIILGHCLCGQVIQNGRIVTSAPGDQYLYHMPCHDSEAGSGHHCVPIQSGNNLLGVLNLFVSHGHECNSREEAFLITVSRTLAAVIERRRMEESIHQAQRELRETRLEIIQRLGVAAEYRDTDTGEHIIRMSRYASALGRSLGMSAHEVDLLLHATPMHDVGKIGIPDHILLKPARLTADEFEIIKKHPLIGASILFGQDAEPLKTAHIIALTHHERWDGSGYPYGLKGESIPLVGRICALVDVFDALTMARPYKRAWSAVEALEEIEKNSGRHFDPCLVEKFRSIFPEILMIMNHPNHGEPGLLDRVIGY